MILVNHKYMKSQIKHFSTVANKICFCFKGTTLCNLKYLLNYRIYFPKYSPIYLLLSHDNFAPLSSSPIYLLLSHHNYSPLTSSPIYLMLSHHNYSPLTSSPIYLMLSCLWLVVFCHILSCLAWSISSHQISSHFLSSLLK